MLNFTLTQLRYLVAVDQYRHFAKAAKYCAISQPTLSMQLQKLEETLGATLFDRSKQPVVPTPIGIEVVAQARAVLRAADHVEEVVENQREGLRGEYRLGIIPTLTTGVLPLFLARFTQDYPDVSLVIEEMKTELLIDALESDAIDAGLAATPLGDSQLEERPLFYERFVAYLSSNHPLLNKKSINEQDLETHSVWLLGEGHCFRNQVTHLCSRARDERKNHVAFESGSFETLIALVDQGMGMTLLPELLATKVQNPALIRNLGTKYSFREVSLVRRRHMIRAAITQAVQDCILEALPKELHRTLDRSEILDPRPRTN